jgi:hypothetical protein
MRAAVSFTPQLERESRHELSPVNHRDAVPRNPLGRLTAYTICGKIGILYPRIRLNARSRPKTRCT